MGCKFVNINANCSERSANSELDGFSRRFCILIPHRPTKILVEPAACKLLKINEVASRALASLLITERGNGGNRAAKRAVQGATRATSLRFSLGGACSLVCWRSQSQSLKLALQRRVLLKVVGKPQAQRFYPRTVVGNTPLDVTEGTLCTATGIWKCECFVRKAGQQVLTSQ